MLVLDLFFLAPASREHTGSYHSPIINGSELKIEKGTWGVTSAASVENSYWRGLPPEDGSDLVRDEMAPLDWHRYERI